MNEENLSSLENCFTNETIGTVFLQLLFSLSLSLNSFLRLKTTTCAKNREMFHRSSNLIRLSRNMSFSRCYRFQLQCFLRLFKQNSDSLALLRIIEPHFYVNTRKKQHFACVFFKRERERESINMILFLSVAEKNIDHFATCSS